MNKSLIKTLTVFLLLINVVSAQPDWEQFESGVVPVFQDVLCIIYRVMVYIAGPIGVLAFVWAGVKWVYSQDDAAERERAKEIMLQVIIALMLIKVSKNIAEFIMEETFVCTL